jgi:tetratricopeptide (TPR) repeat protein
LAVQDLYDKACEAANKGNYGYAIELYREVLRLEPEYEGARVLLRGTERRRMEENASLVYKALCLLRGLWPFLKATVQFNKPRKRLESCEDFLEWNPNNTTVLLMAGKAARKARLNEASKSILKDLLSQQPENKAALQSLGDQFQQDGQTREALKYLGRLADLKPEDRTLQAQVKNMEAQAHMQDTRMEEAGSFRDMIRDEEFAEEAERSFETVAERRQKMIRQTEEEVAAEPDNISKVVRLAELYMEENRFREALTLLEEAHENQPDNYQLREKLGDVRLEICDHAMKRVEEGLEQDPENEKLQERKKKLRSKRRRLAVREYGWRAKQHPTDRELRLKLGYAYYDNGMIDKAIGAFQQSARDPRMEVEASSMMGRCFMDKQQYDLAEEQLRRAIEKHGRFDDKGMELNYHLAVALEETGRTEEALKIYKKIYTNDINFRDVAQKVESLRE